MTDAKLTGLQKAHQLRQARVAAGIPLVTLNPIEKHFKNPTSLRMALNAKCFDCVGQDSDVGFRRRIGTCTVVKCPLHTVRPYQKNDDTDDEDQTTVP